MTPLRIGVVGVGHMGRWHADKVAKLSRDGRRVALAGIFDADAERAAEVAAGIGTSVATDCADLYARCDAVVIAVPTVEHARVASEALSSGLDVLLEKPIAATLEEAEALVALADEKGRILQVGHQEWFNGAMRVVRERITKPRFAEIHRMGPFPDRGTDVDVVRDLMIHDLEILQQLLGGEPDRVDAVGIPVLTDHVDIANARLTFANRCVANLTASRVTATPMRKFRLFQKDAYFSIDFLEQKSVLFRRLPSEGGEPPRIDIEQLEEDPEDSLMLQMEVFIRAVESRELTPSDGVAPVGVSGAHAASALRTALRVIDAMPDTDDLA